MAEIYRQRIGVLDENLQNEDGRAEAEEVLRTLINQVTLGPTEAELAIVLRGDLAAILRFAATIKTPTSFQRPEFWVPCFRKYRWLRGHATPDTGEMGRKMQKATLLGSPSLVSQNRWLRGRDLDLRDNSIGPTPATKRRRWKWSSACSYSKAAVPVSNMRGGSCMSGFPIASLKADGPEITHFDDRPGRSNQAGSRTQGGQ